MDSEPIQESSQPSKLMPMVWLALALLGTLVAGAGIGISAADSESAGMIAAQIAAFPLGFVLGGALAGLLIHYGIKRATTLLRVLGPLGCGCMSGMLMLSLFITFFTVIFPAL